MIPMGPQSTGHTITMKTFLHIGCNLKRKDKTTAGFNTPDWQELRLDIDPTVEPDIVASMLDMAPVADASVDAVYSSHNIEHLYAHEVGVALGEFRRVLKPDGFLVITCPDLQSVCALVVADKLTEPAYSSKAGPVTPLDILYGFRPRLAEGNLFMAHHCGFTQTVLTATLQVSGFSSIAARRRPNHLDLWALATASPQPDETLRALALAHFPE